MFKYINNLFRRRTTWTYKYDYHVGLTDSEIIWLNMFEEHEYLDLINRFIYNELMNKPESRITIAYVTKRLMKEQNYRVK